MSIQTLADRLRTEPAIAAEMQALARRIVDWYEEHGVRLGSAASQQAAGEALNCYAAGEMTARLDAR